MLPPYHKMLYYESTLYEGTFVLSYNICSLYLATYSCTRTPRYMYTYTYSTRLHVHVSRTLLQKYFSQKLINKPLGPCGKRHLQQSVRFGRLSTDCHLIRSIDTFRRIVLELSLAGQPSRHSCDPAFKPNARSPLLQLRRQVSITDVHPL